MPRKCEIARLRKHLRSPSACAPAPCMERLGSTGVRDKPQDSPRTRGVPSSLHCLLTHTHTHLPLYLFPPLSRRLTNELRDSILNSPTNRRQGSLVRRAKPHRHELHHQVVGSHPFERSWLGLRSDAAAATDAHMCSRLVSVLCKFHS